MEFYTLLYPNTPRLLRLPVLYILYFVILVANGVFLGNIVDMYSGLAVNAEPYTMAYNSMYIGMSLGLFFHARLKMLFSNKTLLVSGLTVMLLMNGICATSGNVLLIVLACLAIGFAKISALVEVYVIWMYIWSKKGDSSRMYPFVYFTALSGLYLITWVTTRLTAIYNYRFAYICVILLLLLCLLLTILFVENHPLKRKVPMFRADYLGLLLLGVSMMLLNYAVVYGKLEDWLASKRIFASFLFSAIFFLLFIKRQLQTKHPLLDLNIFKHRNLRIGLMYFLLLGIFVPGTFQSAFSGSILQYDMSTNMELTLYLIPGILAGSVLCFFWYYYKCEEKLLIFTGFLSFVVYHFLMYSYFSTVFTIHYFWLPSVVKGFGIALLYIAVGLSTTRNFGIPGIMGAAGAMILVRSFLGSGIFSSLYSYFLYAKRLERFNYLLSSRDSDRSVLNTTRSNLSSFQTLQEQAILTSSKEITGYIIFAGLVVLVIVAIHYVTDRIRATDA